ncbi:MAG: hypothetical protein WC545_03380 [Patescibacteria group bacterium]|jgi:hypothetical protein
MIKISRQFILREFFYFFGLLFLVLFLMEIIWPNIILAYLNFNFLFIIVLIFGILFLRSCHQTAKSKEEIRSGDDPLLKIKQ